MKATKRYSLGDQRENSRIEKCVNEKEKRKKGGGRDWKRERMVSYFDNEMDALGCVVAKWQHG